MSHLINDKTMKHINLFLMLCVLCIAVYGISACSKEENHKPDTDQSIPAPEPDPTPEPEPNNYIARNYAGCGTISWKKIF